MAVFSTNQVRQFYVANEVTDFVSESAAEGAISVALTKDGNEVYFPYAGANGNLMRSDLIPVKNITYAKLVDGATMAHPVKAVKVTLKNDVLTDGKPATGQDYLLRVVINSYIGMSDEEPYIKYGIVHTYGQMSASEFYAKMAVSLAKNFSRELAPMLSFGLITDVEGEGGVTVETSLLVTAKTDVESLTGTYKGILIEEVDQEWSLGIKPETYVDFSVYPTTVTIDGDEVPWGEAKEQEATKFIDNGRKIADLEYFCMGERGDVYRGTGFPNVIPTKYLVKAFDAQGKPNKYHVFEIHYAFTDEGIGVQRSEKDIEIVSTDRSALEDLAYDFLSMTGFTVDMPEGEEAP